MTEKEMSSIQLTEADNFVAAGNDSVETRLAAAQVHATLALVEVAERLAVAQEAANLIAFVNHVDNSKDPGDEMVRMALRAVVQATLAMGL